jgi:hypothetical protein
MALNILLVAAHQHEMTLTNDTATFFVETDGTGEAVVTMNSWGTLDAPIPTSICNRAITVDGISGVLVAVRFGHPVEHAGSQINVNLAQDGLTKILRISAYKG